MVQFTQEQTEKLNLLTAFMLDYNQKVNLTAITQPEQVWQKHYIDSAYPLKLVDVPRGTQIIDIGTGAGFPGVVWKLLRPDLRVTLLDSLRKRIDYLNLLRSELCLEYTTIHARCEELSLNPDYREAYDIAVSRAVANLPALCELCLPFVKVGGLFLSMKGAESEHAEYALHELGGKVREIKYYELPEGDKRSLVMIEKIKKSPSKYPRQRVNIFKNPL